MRFAFTDEQVEFRAMLRRFLQSRSPTTEVRRLMETDEGYDQTVWRQLTGELGLAGIHIPEIYGGQGFGFVELGIALEEAGRALLCAPFFSSVALAATAILNGATEEQKRALLPGIAAGDTTAALAFTEDNGRWDPAGVETTATASDGGYRLDGTKSFVIDGHTAGLIVVLARRPGSSGEEGLSLFTVAADAPGLERRLLKTMDPTRKQARLTFRSVPAELIGSEGGAADGFRRTLDQAAACLANEMAGGAEQLLESAIDYAMMRVQFGRQIASFQSLKHKAADMLLEVEMAKSAAYYAAAAADENSADFPAAASLAKACTSETYMQTAIHTIQIHGGIGFTWDQDCHLWFKRAKSSEVLLGDPSYHRELMMQRWQA